MARSFLVRRISAFMLIMCLLPYSKWVIIEFIIWEFNRLKWTVFLHFINIFCQRNGAHPKWKVLIHFLSILYIRKCWLWSGSQNYTHIAVVVVVVEKASYEMPSPEFARKYDFNESLFSTSSRVTAGNCGENCACLAYWRHSTKAFTVYDCMPVCICEIGKKRVIEREREWMGLGMCRARTHECMPRYAECCVHLPHKWMLLFNNQKEVSRVAQTVKHPI